MGERWMARPERTLIDFAEITGHRGLERATDEAARLRLTTEARLRRATDRHPGRPGAARLRALLSDHALGTTATENDFEELLVGICDGFGIPRPSCQAPVGRYRPDFAWPAQRVLVEADSWESHGTRAAFEQDRRRDNELRAGGWIVLRFTWRQLTRERDWVASMISHALGR